MADPIKIPSEIAKAVAKLRADAKEKTRLANELEAHYCESGKPSSEAVNNFGKLGNRKLIL